MPDAFLSLGVERCYDEELRPSYVLWDEEIVPSLVIEIVSPTYRQEYTTKLERYAAIESILAQDYPNIEHIINNQSTQTKINPLPITQ